MPSADTLSLCVYGDSHIACIKRALNEGRVDLSGVALEFWGAPGPRFRDIHLQEGRLVPTTPEAQDMLAHITDTGRATLAAQDFQSFLFVGCRLRAQEYLVPLLWRQTQEAGFLSRAVRDTMLTRWLDSCRSYRVARDFAREAHVCFAPAPFLNDQVLGEKDVARTINTGATAEQRAALWDGIAEAMQRDGVTLLRQPEETVTRGALTRREYAVDNAQADQDSVHKNGSFGALILSEAVRQARSHCSKQLSPGSP